MDLYAIMVSEYVRILCVLLSIPLAYIKGRRIILWAVITYMFSFFALLILFMRSDLPRKNYALLEQIIFRIKELRIRRKLKSVETPEDFFKG